MENDLKSSLSSEESSQDVFTAEDIEKIFGGTYVQSADNDQQTKFDLQMQNQSVASDNLS